MRIIATITVRMGSSRLPGKPLKPVLGKPLLEYLIERVLRAKRLDGVVVCTSTRSENDPIESLAQRLEVPCYRGSENDILERTLGALKMVKADVGVNIFGDCPLLDPEIIDCMVGDFLKRPEFDFVGNDLKTTFPPGMEVEVYKASALERSSKMTCDPRIREHGTLYLRTHPDQFSIMNVEAPEKWQYPDLEIELDTEEDFIVIQSILENLYPTNPQFGLDAIIEFLKQNSKVARLNQKVPRRWKEFRSDI